MHQVYIMRWKYNEVAESRVRVVKRESRNTIERGMNNVQFVFPYNREGGREKETGGKAIAEGINSRYSRNIGATKCKLIGKRGARGGTGGGEGRTACKY